MQGAEYCDKATESFTIPAALLRLLASLGPRFGLAEHFLLNILAGC